MKQFTYLHFSDLHMGNKVAKPFLSHIKSELLKDIKYISGELGHIDVVFMTGDLAQSGSETEYKEFEVFMNSILTLLNDKGSNPYLFFVPGNHDLERLLDTDTSDPTHQTMKMWNNNPDFRKNIFWKGDTYIKYCKERFYNYTNFVKRYSNIPSDITKVGLLPGDFYTNVDVNGVKLGVLGLNSSFLQIEAGDYTGKLGIYLKQIESIFGSHYVETLNQNDVNILLTHHKFDWYEPDSRSEYQGEIYLKDQILEHYCGHNHIPQTDYTSHNYAIESRVNVCPSLCGLEYYDDKIERIHGYHAGRYIINDDGSIVKQIYPRLAVQRNSVCFIDRDINYQCEKGKEYAEVTLKEAHSEAEEHTYSASEIADILSDDKPKTGSIQLHPITIHGDHAYNKVRIQEQKEAEEALKKTRSLWICSSFGLGEEQFLACVLRTLQVDLKGVFQLNCEDVETYAGLDKLVREHFSVSLNNIVDELSLACELPTLIFSGITKNLVDNELAALSTMVSSMTKYNEQVRMVFISSEIPADGYFSSIQLQPLSKSDVKHFVDASMPGKEFTSFEIDKILDITNGYPLCLDIIIKQLEYASLEDLNEADFSFSQDELKIPMAIKSYIHSLKNSSQSSERNCYSLLVLLSLLPKGDTYSSIRRYNSTSPYKPAEVDILKSRNLITIDHYYVIKNHSLISSIDVLRIPKIFRDFILGLELSSQESFLEICFAKNSFVAKSMPRMPSVDTIGCKSKEPSKHIVKCPLL